MIENRWIKKDKIKYNEYDDKVEQLDVSSLPDGKGKKKFVNLFLVGGFAHNEQTKKILDSIELGKISSFLREAIITFANDKGFIELENNAEKPAYVTLDMWRRIIGHQGKNPRIDLVYVVAFSFLWSLPEFRNYSRSRILRKIIISHADQ